MAERITPYKEGGDITDRIDEIVAEKASVHFEMIDNSTAVLFISSGDVERHYSVYAKGRTLILRLHDESPLANQLGKT